MKNYILNNYGDAIYFDEREGGIYYFLTSTRNGLTGETDDVGPFDTLYEAIEAAIDSLSANPDDEEGLETAFNLLMHAIADGVHDFDPNDFQARMGLEDGWDWSDFYPADVRRIHDAIHAGLR